MRTEAILNLITNGIIKTNENGEITYMNPAAQKLTGHTFADSVSRDLYYVFGRANIENSKKLRAYFEGIYSNDSKYVGAELSIFLKGRTFDFFALNLKMSKLEKGGYLLEISDETDAKNFEHQINMLFNYYPSVLFTVDRTGQFIDINKKTEEKLKINGLSGGVKWFSLIADSDFGDVKKFFAKAIKSKQPQSTILNFLDGDSQKYCDITVLPINKDKFYISVNDQTAKINYREKLNTISIKDTLTDAFNRNYLDILSESLMETADRYSEAMTGLAIEIVQFKKIINRYGYDIGDLLLKSVARRIIDISRKSDALFRLSSDRFILLLPKTNETNAVVVAEKIQTAVESMTFTAVKKIRVAVGVCERKNYESQRRWIQKCELTLDRALKTKTFMAIYREGDLEKKKAKTDVVLKTLSNNKIIDEEHQNLLKIKDTIELPKQDKEYIGIEKFVDMIKQHFESEVDILEANNYPEVDHHIETHSRMMDRAEMVISKVQSGVLDEKTAMYYIFDELLYKHLSNDDTEYFYIFK
ncbi:MAG: diguanylate cyclase [Clostridia bacterium]|nr:diguanylate cyclase [Clostridia bacterium]